MIHEKINLKTIYPQLKGGNEVVLTSYCLDNFDEWSTGRKRKAILILPGGGYHFISEREAEPIAVQYLHEDINAFVLSYTVKNEPSYNLLSPIDEVFAAILYIKSHADYYHVDVEHISVMGFSAGGHLAASVGLFYQDAEYLKLFNCTTNDLYISGLILCYPVITMGEYSSKETKYLRTGLEEDLIDKFSIEKHIDANYPPTFIWTTFEDDCVPPLNSTMLVNELVKHNVRVEFHLYPEGKHGLALANEITQSPFNNGQYVSVQTWVKQSIRFIKDYL